MATCASPWWLRTEVDAQHHPPLGPLTPPLTPRLARAETAHSRPLAIALAPAAAAGVEARPSLALPLPLPPRPPLTRLRFAAISTLTAATLAIAATSTHARNVLSPATLAHPALAHD